MITEGETKRMQELIRLGIPIQGLRDGKTVFVLKGSSKREA